jgi:hypothetical protein
MATSNANVLFGQNVEMRITRDSGIEQSLTDCHEFSVTDDLILKENGYLGEASNRTISIYNKTHGSLQFHIEALDAFRLKRDLIARAQRKIAYFKVNIICTMVTPDSSDEVTFVFPDIQITQPKVDVPKRDELVNFSAEWSCDAPQLVG